MRWTLLLGLSLPLVMSCTLAKESPVTPDVAAAVVDPTVLPFAALDLVIDADAAMVQIDHRTVAEAGEALTIDLSTFMRTENALRIDGIRRIDAETIGLTISIRHPIPMPPEGQEPRFHATDVLGIFLFDGTQAMDFTDASGQVQAERIVPGWLDADGYSGMLNVSFTERFATSCTMHPYVVLSEDTRPPNYDPNTERGWLDVRNPIGFNVLPQGADWRSTEAVLHLPPGQHRVRLAVQGTIQEIPLFDGEGKPIPARYAYPEGSQQAPWKLETEVWNPGLIEGGPANARCEVDVIAHDWQHGSQVRDPWTMELNKNDVRLPSQVSHGLLLLPDLNEEATSGVAFQYYASRDEPWSTTFEVVNKKQAQSGFHWGFVMVYDSREDIRLFDSAGREIAPAAHPDHRTGQVVQIPIASAGGPDFITRLEVAALDRVFLAEGEIYDFVPEAVWASGLRTPIDESQFTHKFNHPLWQQRVTVEDLFTLRRIQPRDDAEWLKVRTVPIEAAARVRATTFLSLGNPYPFGASMWAANAGTGPNCGGSVDPSPVFDGPRGAGTAAGNSDHVVSLGYNGVLSLQMTDGYILDKPGPDFIVFENAFEIGQDPDQIFTETVMVEVSQDQQTWVAFPMDYRPVGSTPWRNPANFSGVAGITPVLANVETNHIDPTDPTVAGGDAFDLADVGLEWASWIRLYSTGIDDTSPCYSGCPFNTRMTDFDGDLIDDEGKHGTCSGTVGGPDIDAVAIVKGHQGFPEQ